MRRLGPVAALLGILLLAAPSAHARTFSGTLYVEHGDDVRDGRDVAQDVLYTAGGRRLQLSGRTHVRLSGSRVTVAGVARGRRLTVRRMTVRHRARLRMAATGPVSGPATTAVVMFNFLNQTSTVTPDDIRGALFTAPNSTNALFSEESFGQLSLTGAVRPDGDVFGPYTIPYNAGWSCSYSAWASAARSAAQSAGVDLSPYQHVIYWFPGVAACGWAGMAQVSGSTVWINGENQPGLYAHELGHNFGLEHAQSESCTSGGVPVALSSNCAVDEYGDPFDPMGDPYNNEHNSGFSLGRLGLLAAADTQTVSADGSYDLVAPELAQTGAKQIRIPRPGGDYLYLEARRNSGGIFDAFPLGSPVNNGVLVRVGPDLSSWTNSRLVDAHPLTPTFDDAALGLGESLTDPTSGVTVTVTGSSAAGATVNVSSPAPDTTPPSVPGGLTATATTRSVGLTWSAASDDVGVTGYRVYRDGTLLTTVRGTGFTDGSVASGQTYGYQVAAVDAAGNASDLSAAAVTTVPQPPPDTTAPTAPSGLTAYVDRGRIRLAWAPSSDDVGVTAYRVSRDGVVIATVAGTRATDATAVPGVTSTYTVTALDAAGNESAPSAAATATLPARDTTAPSVPSGLSASVTRRGVLLTWQPSTDASGIARYIIYRNGRPVGSVRRGTAARDVGARRGRTFTYNVAAVDMAGNRSALSAPVTVTPGATMTRMRTRAAA